MKRLLMKWFPNYFVINNHTTTWLDSKNMEKMDGLKVIELNPDDEHLTGGLGITEERAIELAKAVDIQFLQCNNIVEVMVNLTANTVNHANESFFVSFLIVNKMNKRSSPVVDGFIEFLRNRGNNKGDQ